MKDKNFCKIHANRNACIKNLFSRRFFYGLIFYIFLTFLAMPVLAQESGPLVKRLTWQPVEFTSGYEIVVEVLSYANTWVEITRKYNKTETFIEMPLFAGHYRFMVTVYDLLGNLGPSTDWEHFEVRAIVKEEPPKEVVKEVVIVEVEVVVEVEKAEEEKIEEKTETPPPVVKKKREKREIPKGPPEEENKTFLRFEFIYQPFIVLPFCESNEKYFSSPLQPLGFAFRISIIPILTNYGVFGLEICPSWNFMVNDIFMSSAKLLLTNEFSYEYTNIMAAKFSLVWQTRPLGRRSALNIRLGGGPANVFSHFEIIRGNQLTDINSWEPFFAGGISFVDFINRSIFVNASVEYFHIFAGDNQHMNFIRPEFTIGIWF